MVVLVDHALKEAVFTIMRIAWSVAQPKVADVRHQLESEDAL